MLNGEKKKNINIKIKLSRYQLLSIQFQIKGTLNGVFIIVPTIHLEKRPISLTFSMFIYKQNSRMCQ